jgi:hypothetical protein
MILAMISSLSAPPRVCEAIDLEPLRASFWFTTEETPSNRSYQGDRQAAWLHRTLVEVYERDRFGNGTI